MLLYVLFIVCFMLIPSRQNLKKNDNYSLAQCLKLAGVTGILIAGAETLGQSVNKTAAKMTSKDYLVGVAIASLVGGSVYGGLSLFVPMWREVTEYRPDESPFIRIPSYLDLPHHHVNDDLYS